MQKQQRRSGKGWGAKVQGYHLALLQGQGMFQSKVAGRLFKRPETEPEYGMPLTSQV